jgi:hypothetical protein
VDTDKKFAFATTTRGRKNFRSSSDAVYHKQGGSACACKPMRAGNKRFWKQLSWQVFTRTRMSGQLSAYLSFLAVENQNREQTVNRRKRIQARYSFEAAPDQFYP